VRAITALYSALHIPGGAEGPTATIGLADVTWAYGQAPVISYTDYSKNSTPTSTVATSFKAKGEYKRADNPFQSEINQNVQMLSLPCPSADPELFFNDSAEVVAQAKALCGSCPMKAKCLQGALSRAEPCGVWGGELFDEGQVIQSKRSPGRPAKVAAAS